MEGFLKLNKKARAAVGTLAVVTGVGAAMVAGGATAANQGTTTTEPPTTTTTTTTTIPPLDEQTVYMRGTGKDLRFEFEGIGGSDVLVRGEPLNVVNETDPQGVGPHTFTLLSQPTIDKAPNGRKCFTPKEICRIIADWHEFVPPETVNKPVVRVGGPGWNQKGTKRKKGDSWFSGQQDEEFSQDLTSNQQRLRFFCAVHPNMRGSIEIEDAIPTK
ncbi:hypothetical protein HJD18_08020 [Thermoleophilia bacterium SCSIO 60948]|nr:hypothetical protein HJD18_08020 [Thermoleophilia bacterium SCSIO 60948]